MGNENWLDPEFGIVNGLSGFNSGKPVKLASSPDLAQGLDMLEMVKEMTKEAYETSRPDDGISGSRTAIVVHVEELPFEMIKDPVMADLFKVSTDIAQKDSITVVYAAPSGGSCSMLPKGVSDQDFASIYRFPRFYTFEPPGDIEPGMPCEVSYLDEDTLSFGLFIQISSNGIQIPTTDLYRPSSERQDAKNAFDDISRKSSLVESQPRGFFSFASDAIRNATDAYHVSVLVSKNNPFGEKGGGRIKNNVELNKKRDGITIARPYSYKGRVRTVEKNAYRAYVAMYQAALADGALVKKQANGKFKNALELLQIRSAFRSVSHQTRLWEKALRDRRNIEGAAELNISVKAYARKYTAPPGRSRHHSGRAIDLHLGYPISRSYISKMKATAAFAWLLENAEFYGFYNYEREPWHWEFNPDARIQRVGSDGIEIVGSSPPTGTSA